jgi:hypothetical protein
MTSRRPLSAHGRSGLLGKPSQTDFARRYATAGDRGHLREERDREVDGHPEDQVGEAIGNDARCGFPCFEAVLNGQWTN